MTAADKLIQRLERVRRTGPNRWSARCPAHDDKSPSLSVRELDDGRVLVRCFAGCGVDEVVSALGLDIGDLFPERDPTPGAGKKRERRPFNAMDLLDLAAFESSVACIVVADLLAGRDAEVERLLEAAVRLADIAEMAHGPR